MVKEHGDFDSVDDPTMKDIIASQGMFGSQHSVRVLNQSVLTFPLMRNQSATKSQY